MVFVIGIIFIPIVGKYVDRHGKRPAFVICALTVMVIAQTLFLVLPSVQGAKYYAILALLLVGCYYALYAGSIWPMIPMVVEKKHTATAYGVNNSLLHIGLVVMCISLGRIEDKTLAIQSGYFYFEVFLLVVVILGLMTSVWLYFEDKIKHSSLLMNSFKK